VPVNLLFTWVGHGFLFDGFSEYGRKAFASLLGIIISIFTNFLLNDFWTWRDREKVRDNFFTRLAMFYVVCSLASAIQFGTYLALTIWLNVYYLIAQMIGIVLATVLNFVANNAWTFRKKANVASSPEKEIPE